MVRTWHTRADVWSVRQELRQAARLLDRKFKALSLPPGSQPSSAGSLSSISSTGSASSGGSRAGAHRPTIPDSATHTVAAMIRVTVEPTGVMVAADDLSGSGAPGDRSQLAGRRRDRSPGSAGALAAGDAECDLNRTMEHQPSRKQGRGAESAPVQAALVVTSGLQTGISHAAAPVPAGSGLAAAGSSSDSGAAVGPIAGHQRQEPEAPKCSARNCKHRVPTDTKRCLQVICSCYFCGRRAHL